MSRHLSAGIVILACFFGVASKSHAWVPLDIGSDWAVYTPVGEIGPFWAWVDEGGPVYEWDWYWQSGGYIDQDDWDYYARSWGRYSSPGKYGVDVYAYDEYDQSDSSYGYFYAVAVNKIQYNDPDTGYTNIDFPLYVHVGTTVCFKAIRNPSAAAFWPGGKPVWGGTCGASGSGEIAYVKFGTLSSSLSDYKTVTATCGNTVTVNVIVFDFEGVLAPKDGFSGRSTMYYGIEEKVDLDFETDPWSVTAGQAGGLEWTKGSESQPGTLSNVKIDYGTADYDAGATNGTVWLILTIKSGPSKGNWKGYQKDVVLPSGTRMTRVDPNHVWHEFNTASAGIKLYYWLDPTNVSFKYLTFGEDSCAPTPAWGVCSTMGSHSQNTFGAILGGHITNGCRVSAEDHAWCKVTPWNLGDGGWTWNIPTQYIDDTSTRHTFGGTQNHVSQVWANGNATQSKAGHSGPAKASDPDSPW
jgi:hypothetical protein